MLFVYGTRKPFMFHSQVWCSALAARPHSEVHALRANHLVSYEEAADFNELALDWLEMLAERHYVVPNRLTSQR